MCKYLLTQSLLSSWLFIYQAHEGREDYAYADFIATLNRIEKEPTEAMSDGIEFENAVNAVVDGSETKSDSIITIADIVRGGQKQVALYANKTINDIDYLLYGKLDYLKAGIIYDIKYSKCYEAGKYVDSIQHPFYFELCPEAKRFDYLITNGRDVFIEKYYQCKTPGIDQAVLEFMQFLNDCNVQSIYFDKWAVMK